MPSVATISATMVGPSLPHGLTRMRFQTTSLGVPTGAEVAAAQAAMLGFWATFANRVFAGIVISSQPTAIVQDEATGTTTAEVVSTAIPTSVSGADTSPEFVAGTGGRVDWHTGVRRRSREMRGATFIIPMGSGQFAATGDLTSACVVALEGAATSYIAAMTAAGLAAVVYGRPLAAHGTHPAALGLAAPIAGVTVPATPAFLRRRRN